jgi:hypothetical protein
LYFDAVSELSANRPSAAAAVNRMADALEPLYRKGFLLGVGEIVPARARGDDGCIDGSVAQSNDRPWERDIEEFGIHGLRATRYQIYRNPRAGQRRRRTKVML